MIAPQHRRLHPDPRSPLGADAAARARALVTACLTDVDLFENELSTVVGEVFAGVEFATGEQCANAVLRTSHLLAALSSVGSSAVASTAAARDVDATEFVRDFALELVRQRER